MANKVTKMDNFNALLALSEVKANPALTDFIKHEIELLEKKAENRSTKPTVRQAENAEIKTNLLTKMELGVWYRCIEIQSLDETLSQGVGTQRTARLCNDMVAEGLLQKKVEKKVVYFALAE